MLSLVSWCRRRAYKVLVQLWRQNSAIEGVPVLIYGAGRRGKSIVQELRDNRALGLHPIGFLDDDSRLIGSKIYGVRVIGSYADLASILNSRKTSALIISSHKITAESLASVMNLCSKQRMPVLRGEFQLDRISGMGSSDIGEASDQKQQSTAVPHAVLPKSTLTCHRNRI